MLCFASSLVFARSPITSFSAAFDSFRLANLSTNRASSFISCRTFLFPWLRCFASSLLLFLGSHVNIWDIPFVTSLHSSCFFFSLCLLFLDYLFCLRLFSIYQQHLGHFVQGLSPRIQLHQFFLCRVLLLRMLVLHHLLRTRKD